MAKPYRKVQRPTFPKPKAGIDYDQSAGPQKVNPEQYSSPAGPQEASGAEKIKQAVMNWGRRGIENFRENAQRGIRNNPNDDIGEMQARPQQRGRPSQRRVPEPPMPFFNIPQNQGLDIDIEMLGASNLDMCMHPDPMYSRGCYGREERAKKRPSRTVTRTEYY